MENVVIAEDGKVTLKFGEGESEETQTFDTPQKALDNLYTRHGSAQGEMTRATQAEKAAVKALEDAQALTETQADLLRVSNEEKAALKKAQADGKKDEPVSLRDKETGEITEAGIQGVVKQALGTFKEEITTTRKKETAEEKQKRIDAYYKNLEEEAKRIHPELKDPALWNEVIKVMTEHNMNIRFNRLPDEAKASGNNPFLGAHEMLKIQEADAKEERARKTQTGGSSKAGGGGGGADEVELTDEQKAIAVRLNRDLTPEKAYERYREGLKIKTGQKATFV